MSFQLIQYFLIPPRLYILLLSLVSFSPFFSQKSGSSEWVVREKQKPIKMLSIVLFIPDGKKSTQRWYTLGEAEREKDYIFLANESLNNCCKQNNNPWFSLNSCLSPSFLNKKCRNDNLSAQMGDTPFWKLEIISKSIKFGICINLFELNRYVTSFLST